MDNEQTIDEAIESNAKGERSIAVDGESVTAHSVKDQIAAAKHLGSNIAVRGKTRGLSFAKLKPPGTT